MELVACPSCGYKTILEDFDICEICLWEHDPVQERNPDSTVGANRTSLRKAQEYFKAFGAHNKASVEHVRPLTKDDVRDPNWEPIG